MFAKMKVVASSCVISFVALGQTGTRITPPALRDISPRGVARGTTVEITVEGFNLAQTSQIFFNQPGVTGRIVRVKELPDLPDIRLGLIRAVVEFRGIDPLQSNLDVCLGFILLGHNHIGWGAGAVFVLPSCYPCERKGLRNIPVENKRRCWARFMACMSSSIWACSTACFGHSSMFVGSPIVWRHRIGLRD